MKKKHLYLLSLAFIGIFGRADAQCGWVPLGPNDTNQIAFGNTEYNSVAVDPTTNNVYVGYWDENNYGAAVREWVASTGQWQNVGPATICAKKTPYTAMTVDKHGIPYFACQNPNRTLDCNVWMWNTITSMWDSLSPTSITSAAQWISLTTDKNGVPYVAFEDVSHGDKLDVLMYNGTTWTPVGGHLGISAGQAQYVSLAFDTVNNIPYVAYEDQKHSDEVSVLAFNGTTWMSVGADTAITSDTGSWVSLKVDYQGHPYVSYEDFSNAAGLSVMTYNGTAWASVGTGLASTTGGPVTYTNIGVDASDNVYVSYVDGSSYGYSGLSAVEYTKSSGLWNYVGGSYSYSQDFSLGKANYIGMAMDTTGAPAIVYVDNGIGNHVELYRWMKASKYWYFDRGEGFTDGGVTATKNGVATYISIGANPISNDIYSSYGDGNSKGKTTVQKYSTGAWSVVGTPGISLGAAKFTNIGFDHLGNPIVMYTDAGNTTNKYSIATQIFTSGAWTPIGTNQDTLSGGDAYYVSMAVKSTASTDTVYAAFELKTNYSMTVMKCAVGGSKWQFVGSANGNSDSAAYESIALDKNGVIYVAFQDNAANSNAVSVMKYVSGTGWQYVGTRGFSGVESVYPSLQIDPADNMPVVAFSAYTSGANEACMKFNGTSWNYIGPSGGFSYDYSNQTNLSIDKSGNYYVAYQDWASSGYDAVPLNFGYRNVTAEKYIPNFDTAWEYLPPVAPYSECSMGGSSYQATCVDNAGNFYVGFSSASGYVKELSCPEGINEINGNSNNFSASVYPNPNNGAFTVALQNASAKSYISVYNVLGENVYTSMLTSDKTQINLNNQPTGIYLYRILAENGQVLSTGKLIIK